MSSFDFAARFVPTADAPAAAWITTAHVAVGSLILATGVLLSLRSARLASRRWPSAGGRALLWEAAL
jgi:hypothetical protein